MRAEKFRYLPLDNSFRDGDSGCYDDGCGPHPPYQYDHTSDDHSLYPDCYAMSPKSMDHDGKPRLRNMAELSSPGSSQYHFRLLSEPVYE
jgi:hypothetical protein